MRVVCINIETLVLKDKYGEDWDYVPEGLIKGEIYNVSKVQIDEDGYLTYFIREIDSYRLAIRFRDIEDSWVYEVLEKILNTEEKEVLVYVQ